MIGILLGINPTTRLTLNAKHFLSQPAVRCPASRTGRAVSSRSSPPSERIMVLSDGKTDCRQADRRVVSWLCHHVRPHQNLCWRHEDGFGFDDAFAHQALSSLCVRHRHKQLPCAW